MEVFHLNNESFKKLMAQNEKPVLVDFWATWCGPCQNLAPELEKLAAEHDEIIVGKVDVDQYPELAAEFMVDTIPTLYFFKEGKVVKRLVGFMSKEMLAANLNLSNQ
jgi:thioredoxin 1